MDYSIYKRIPMSSIQIACAVLVSLFWGMQFVVIKVGLTAFPPLFFRGSSIRRRRSDFAAVRRVIKPTRTRFDGHHLGLPGRAELRTDLYRTGPRSCRRAGGCSAVVHSLHDAAGVAIPRGAAFAARDTRPGCCVRRRCAVVSRLRCIGSAARDLADHQRRSGAGDRQRADRTPWPLRAAESLGWVPQVLAVSASIKHGQLAALRNTSPAAWWALAYAVFLGGIASFGLWIWLIRRCSMTQVAPYDLL